MTPYRWYHNAAFRDSVRRAINTFAQSLLASIGVSAVTGVAGIAWLPVLSIAALATIISLLQSVVCHTGGPVDG